MEYGSCDFSPSSAAISAGEEERIAAVAGLRLFPDAG